MSSHLTGKVTTDTGEYRARMDLTCPHCGNTEQAKMMGHEIRGVYDGVLYWACMSCGWAWSRDFGPGRRSDLSKQYADEHNASSS